MISLLRTGGLPSLILILAAGGVWLHYQHRVLTTLREQNIQLTRLNARLEARLQQLKRQAASLTGVLDEQKKQHQNLEKKNEHTRQQLHQAVARAPCATEPVPADIIRLQRDALADRNTLSH